MAMHRRILEGKPQKQLKNKAGDPARVVGLPTEKPWEAAGRPGAYDPHARLADMDIDRVDAEVLYASATGGAELYAMDADACLASFQAPNAAAPPRSRPRTPPPSSLRRRTPVVWSPSTPSRCTTWSAR